jgi:predicted TIM-barrel fold metal-dependent hydrolase
MACRWNPNLFFDLSGSLLKYRSPEYLGALLWWTPTGVVRSPDGTDAWQKILFGSDVEAARVAEVVQDYETLMNRLNLRPELREAVRYGTAARVLGLK